MISRTAITALAAILIAAPSALGQTAEWAPPQFISSPPPSGLDLSGRNPKIAYDGGLWIVVWETRSSRDDTDGDIASSRSTDGGVTWSMPVLVNTDGAVDTATDVDAAVAGGNGVFIAAWHRSEGDDRGTYIARSTDGGISWQAPVEIVDFPIDATSPVTPPAIDTDGKGVWAMVSEIDGGLVTTRSDDDGQSWSAPDSLIIRERVPELPDNRDPDIATDRAGNWKIVWTHFGLLPQSFDETDIAFTQSSDNALTWSAPAVLTPTMTADSTFESDRGADVATDGQGRWIVMWSRVDCCSDDDRTPPLMQFSRATENGSNWTDAVTTLSFHSESDPAGYAPAIAADAESNWIAAFVTEAFPAPSSEDSDIAFVESGGDGGFWTDLAPLNPWAESLEDPLGEFDTLPDMATDGNGTWITVWESNYRGSNVPAVQIYASSTRFSGSIEGIATFASNNAPITCGAVRVESLTPDVVVDRIVSVGEGGQYRASNLPEGQYLLSLFAPDAARVSFSVNVIAGQTTFAAFRPATAVSGARIDGIVTDAATGEPLVGVLVEARVNDVLTDFTYTCGTGAYSLIDVTVAKGETTQVALTFNLDNYETLQAFVEVEQGQPAQANATLTKAVGAPASLAGFVRQASDSAAIPNARVTLRGRGPVTAQTDFGGAFAFDAVPEGQYTVVASAAGYIDKEVPRAIGANDVSLLTITLDAGEITNPSDINGDGQINAIDIQQLINIVLGLATGDGDVNGDNQTNAADIQRVILAVLGLG